MIPRRMKPVMLSAPSSAGLPSSTPCSTSVACPAYTSRKSPGTCAPRNAHQDIFLPMEKYQGGLDPNLSSPYAQATRAESNATQPADATKKLARVRCRPDSMATMPRDIADKAPLQSSRANRGKKSQSSRLNRMKYRYFTSAANSIPLCGGGPAIGGGKEGTCAVVMCLSPSL